MKNPCINKHNRIVWNIVTDFIWTFLCAPIRFYIGSIKYLYEAITNNKINSEDRVVQGLGSGYFVFLPVLLYLTTHFELWKLPISRAVQNNIQQSDVIFGWLLFICMSIIIYILIAATLGFIGCGIYNIWVEYKKHLIRKYGVDLAR